MNSLFDTLPMGYYLNNLEIDNDVFAHGGEAVIRRGRLNGAPVAIRQIYSLESSDEQAKNALLKVCSFSRQFIRFCF